MQELKEKQQFYEDIEGDLTRTQSKLSDHYFDNGIPDEYDLQLMFSINKIIRNIDENISLIAKEIAKTEG